MNKRGIRPVLNLPASPAETALGLVAAAGVLFAIVTLALHWAALPERVPTRFGPSGTPIAWGPKGSLLPLAALAFVLYTVFTVLARYPHKFNYLVRITEENAPRQYLLTRSVIGWLKVEVVWLIAYIEWKMVQVALGQAQGLGPSWVWIWPALLFGTLGVYLFNSYRAR